MTPAKITVVVTVYNIAEYLPRFFESMAAQTFKDYRILIVDDGSTDESLQICRSYAERDPRILIHHLEHVGISAARNYSMERLDTEYTVHADGDDYVEPGYLEHLWNAQQKYDADLVISRVAYRYSGKEGIAESFVPRGECYIEKSAFQKELPKLLEEYRLNYLYGKIYKTEFFRTCRVEPDVRQGSDTMINCQYLLKIKDIVLIDDLDYNYIRRSSGSVTSYSGKEAFPRLVRINDFITTVLDKGGYLTDEMLFVINKRILLSAIWVSEKVVKSNGTSREKSEQIDSILRNDRYLQAYTWIKEHRFYQNELTFEPIAPQSGKTYLKRIQKEQRTLRIKAKILSICPKFIKDRREKRRTNANQ